MTEAALHDLDSRLKRIREALSNHLFTEKDLKLTDLEVLKVIKRGFSCVVFLRAHTSGDVRKLVMKTVVHDPVNIAITKKENQAVVEFNILKFLYPKFEKVEKCSVPRPVLVDPGSETYVMEFVEGALLGDEFRSARYFSSREKFETLNEHYHNCGRWLKHFQEFTGVHEEGAEAMIGVIERCNYRLKLIEDLKDSRCPKNLRSKVMGYVQEQFEQMKGEKIYVSGRHGDFGSWNIIAGPLGVTVIDYLGYGEDPISVDLLKMLMNFEDERKYLTYNSHRIETLRKSFLEGFGPLPIVPTPVLAICEAFHRICSALACLSSKETRFHRRIERSRCLTANLGWLTNERKRKPLWPNCDQ